LVASSALKTNLTLDGPETGVMLMARVAAKLAASLPALSWMALASSPPVGSA
jgi:hypothetical protein